MTPEDYRTKASAGAAENAPPATQPALAERTRAASGKRRREGGIPGIAHVLKVQR